jgi:hypothetical protein|tara:strand:+ start:96 stop:971 length:876 start_codon:yes stop_codon:yes gene_type:complete
MTKDINYIKRDKQSSKNYRSYPKKYIPKILTNKDKQIQKREIDKSRNKYKKGKYYTRKKVDSFKSKESPHIIKAKKIYNVENISVNSDLAKKTGCSISGLQKIVQKGQGAYYSSGSRPNQSGHSWGKARLASSITGGKASAVDFSILEKYCDTGSKALQLAKSARRHYGKGTRRVAKYVDKVKYVGGSINMKEKIINFKRGPNDKKYTAVVQDNKTKKLRSLHFGHKDYEQYKDRTNIGLYEKKNHGDIKRQQNYYNRHSGEKNRKKAILKEIKKSKGFYNPKILSHIYLW